MPNVRENCVTGSLINILPYWHHFKDNFNYVLWLMQKNVLLT